MAKKFLLTATVIAVFAGGCDDGSSPTGPDPAVPVDPGSDPAGTVELDFEEFPTGTILDRVDLGDAGSATIHGESVDLAPGTNAAVIFDSANPHPGDVDLGTPNEDFGGPGVGEGGERGQPFQNDRPLGKLLILGENLRDADGDGLVDVPNDEGSAQPHTLEFDFADVGGGTVAVTTITVVDVEQNEPRVRIELFDSMGEEIEAFVLPEVGDNGVGTFSLGPTSGVGRMAIVLNGSGAIDRIGIMP